MKLRHLLSLSLLCTGGILSLQAGQMISTTSSGKDKVTAEPEKHTLFPEDPAGLLTVGFLASQHLTGGYVDTITGLWSPLSRDAFLFLNSRYHYEDNSQLISSTGLGFRKLFREQQIIVGVNAYYDSINSGHDNDFNQAGFGAEVLTKWVDGRINYYLPDNESYVVDRSTHTESFTTFGPGGVVRGRRTERFERREFAVEGLNLEVGFLVPGLEKFTEVRVFAGYHHYNNPYGSDFDGFQARLEARLLPGVIADLEYWDDPRLNGGHWTAGVRASVPFSLVALVRGHNPFEGAPDYFKPRTRDFDERLSEMVVRSHRIQAPTSGNLPAGSRTTTSTTPAPAPVGGGALPIPFE